MSRYLREMKNENAAWWICILISGKLYFQICSAVTGTLICPKIINYKLIAYYLLIIFLGYWHIYLYHRPYNMFHVFFLNSLQMVLLNHNNIVNYSIPSWAVAIHIFPNRSIITVSGIVSKSLLSSNIMKLVAAQARSIYQWVECV